MGQEIRLPRNKRSQNQAIDGDGIYEITGFFRTREERLR